MKFELTPDLIEAKRRALAALTADYERGLLPRVQFEAERAEIIAGFNAFLTGERSNRTARYWAAMEKGRAA